MLKALIIDDEYIVVEGLQKMMNWSKYGIEVVGTAYDGITALELFHTHNPEVVFTDIRMPGMDGLQLIKEIMEEAPKTICIVFSGFNEFEYVREALRLGVTDYLEKPITIPMIEETLDKISDQAGRQSEMIHLKTKWEESQHLLLERAVLDLLLENVEGEDEWREIFGSEWKNVKGIQVIAYHESEYAPPASTHSYHIVSVSDGTAVLWVIFYFETDFELLITNFFSELEKYGYTAGAGNVYTEVNEISKSYKEAKRALYYGIFLEKEGVVHIEEARRSTEVPRGEALQEDIILYHLRNGDEERLEDALKGKIEWLKWKNTDPELAKQEIMRIIYLGYQVVEELKLENFNSSHNGYVLREELNKINTRREMADWLQSQLKEIVALIKEKKFSKKHQAVMKACAYMKQNYNYDLTLFEVADYVGMNPNYFSMLFKEEMECTYINYLTEYRMEMAKKKLVEGEKVTKVSKEVGYRTYRHFVSVFKKYTGMTPGQYKKSRGD